MTSTVLFFLAAIAAIVGTIEYQKRPEKYLAGLIIISLLTAFGASMNEVNHANHVLLQAQEDSLEN